jgi:hypothetical protein
VRTRPSAIACHGATHALEIGADSAAPSIAGAAAIPGSIRGCGRTWTTGPLAVVETPVAILGPPPTTTAPTMPGCQVHT